MEEYYEMFFKRKSVRKFNEPLLISENEMREIKAKTASLVPLDSNIKIKFKIVKRAETTSTFGEYCLLMYSEKKEHYLLNAGYMLEQMDLFFASKDIGACWLGLAKTKEQQIDGLDYVIMIAFGKSLPQDFRKDLSKCNRKKTEEIWDGEFDQNVIDAVRYAPSACNSQPWKIVSENQCVKVYRNTLVKSFIPESKKPYYNTIDMGIFLCFLEIALRHFKYSFKRTLSADQKSGGEYIEIAVYTIQ